MKNKENGCVQASEGWMSEGRIKGRERGRRISFYIHIPRDAVTSGWELSGVRLFGMVWAQQGVWHEEKEARDMLA